MKTKSHTNSPAISTLNHGSQPFISKSNPYFKGEQSSSESAFFNNTNVQFKLNVGKAGDPYEQEADKVADEVVSSPSAGGYQVKPADSISSIQRQPEEGLEEVQLQEEASSSETVSEEEVQLQSENEEPNEAADREEDIQRQEEEQENEAEEEIQRQPEEEIQSQAEEEVQAQGKESEEEIQMKSEEEGEGSNDEEQVQLSEDEDPQIVEDDSMEAGTLQQSEDEVQRQEDDEIQAKAGADIYAGADIEKTLGRQKGLGSPLSDAVSREMETGFGADFNGVRIHTDHIAVRLTKQMRAQAFTHGKDIYFNSGKYSPFSNDGKRLLAHELTHTIQQGAVQRPSNILVPSDPAFQLKEEADFTLIRPELAKAIALARAEIGKVNAQQTNADGTRLGWERLIEYFTIAFGGNLPVHQDIIKYINKMSKKDLMPSWCGIFVWRALKEGGLPIPDWVLGAPSLAFTKQRGPQEIPVPGDIAYKEPFSHFAMVSEVQNPEGNTNPKNAEVRTINGNTAGEDNLGGQVQEKWHKGTNWLGYWNPVGNLDLPPVPLVPPDSAILELEKKGKEDEGPDKEAEKATPAKEIDTAPSSSALPAGGNMPPEAVGVEEDFKVELPPTPDAGPAEKVAEVKAMELQGTSDESMDAFLTASPSDMAITQPGLGDQLNKKAKNEQSELADNPPVLKAESSGDPDAGLTSPDQLKVPNAPSISEGTTESNPAALQPETVEFKGASPNEANQKEVEKKEESGFMGWFKSNFNNFFSSIRTKDDSVSTSAGERPRVNLQGESNPDRTSVQRKEANTQVAGLKDETTDKLKNHPGQKNIKPRVIQENKTTTVKKEAYATVQTNKDDGMANYAHAPLPEDVRKEADDMLGKDVHANVAEARSKTKAAATTRDTDKKSEISKAELEVRDLNKNADKEQKKVVLDNRKKVATHQEEGMKKSADMLGQFDTDANTRETEAKKAVKDKIKSSEDEASTKLANAEKEAENKKQASEKEAAAEKEKLQKEKKKEGFFSRIASAVKKFVKSITAAIDKIFNALRNAVKTIINKAKELAVKAINAARDFIVDKLNKFRDWAKEQVSKYLKDFPALAKAVNGLIDSTVDLAIKGVNAAADTLIAGVEALAKALSAALDKILEVFQTALKAAVEIAGAVLTGDFAEALKIAIKAACKIAGINPKPIFDFLEKAGEQLMGILKNPLGFFKNLVSAVGGGVKNFAKNIKKHLIKGLIGWLTGALSEVAITLPATFDIKGIFSLVMQVLGLTYDNIKARVIKRFPPAEKIFAVLEKSFEIIKLLVTKGPVALWDMIKDSLSNLKEMVMGGIKEFVITTVIKESITWLLGLLNPAGALVKALKLIFDFIMFLIERFQQIKDFVLSVYNSIVAIASGSLGKAMQAVEDALSRSLPVVISLLASLAGLGGIGKTVKKIIGKVTKPINKALDKIIEKIIKQAKKLLKKGKKKAKALKDKVINWWKAKKSFKGSDGKPHKLFFKGSSKSAKLTIASTPSPLENFLKDAKQGADADKLAAIGSATSLLQEINALRPKAADKNNKDAKTAAKSIETKMGQLVPMVNKLLTGKEKSVPILEKYLNKSVINKDGTVKKQFISDFDKDLNKADGKKVYSVREEKKDNKIISVTIRRNANMATGGFMSIYIEENGKLAPGAEKAYKPVHQMYIPKEVKLTESGGVYKAKYSTKTFNGDDGPNFEVEISFDQVLAGNKDKVENRKVQGKKMVLKPAGGARGKTDSASGGFDNAHLIGDRFGGSGKNAALNIYPSSPNYNRKIMLEKESKLAEKVKEGGKESFDMTVTARIKEENKGGNSLKDLLSKEFKKDNPKAEASSTNVEKEMSKDLQKAINEDLKKLPGQFLKVDYQADSHPADIGEDTDYSKSVDEFEKKHINS